MNYTQALFAALALLMGGTQANAQFYINELFFDPPGGGDSISEYIELRGTPGASLDNHYLIFLESEVGFNPIEMTTAATGTIDNIFDLNGYSFGSNGFFTLRQSDNEYTADQIDPSSSNFANSGPGIPPFGTEPGFGNGAASTIGHSDVGGEGVIENGAFSALLIKNVGGLAPVLGEDLDVGNDGLDHPDGKAGWQILDSVGQSERDETESARFYAQINFGWEFSGYDPNTFVPNVEPGAELVVLPYEIELLARWGNSTGQTEADWHATNVTDNSGSGFLGPTDFRQAGNHPQSDGNENTPAPQPNRIETNRDVPYGTRLTDTIGSPNYLTGDYNGDGVVDAADYTVWRDDEQGDVVVGMESAHPRSDANHDFKVNGDDYGFWVDNFGSPNAAASFAFAAPEPASLMTVLVGGTLAGLRRRV